MLQTLSQHIIEARERFPRGLEQPEGSLRFGADALLLAAFAARHLPPQKSGPDECGPDKHLKKLRAGATSTGLTLVAELGCGCGAALLGLAMLRPEIRGLGLERENPLILAAKGNAARLGLSDRLRFIALDLEDIKALATLPAPAWARDFLPTEAVALPLDSREKDFQTDAVCTGIAPPYTVQPDNIRRAIAQPDAVQPDLAQPASNRLDAVLANPPYDRGGRPSIRNMRERALRTPTGVESHKTALDIFCRAAATLLRHQGRFFCVYDAQALPRLCVALNAVRLGVRRILPVQSHSDGPALRVLVEARKNAAHDTVLETSLILHHARGSNAPDGNAPDGNAPDGNAPDGDLFGSNAPHNNVLCGSESLDSRPCGEKSLWSAQALAFCPWLGVADSPRTADNAFTAL